MRPTVILFDIDGTLVDTGGAGRRALEEAFRRVHGLGDIAERAREVRFEGKTDSMIIVEMAERAGIPEARIASLRAELDAAYVGALEEEMARPDPRRRVLPGVVPLLRELDGREDVLLGLLTGNTERGARLKLEPFGLNRYFPAGGFASDHADRSSIARTACERVAAKAGAKVDPGDVVVVGDTPHDIACARANGFRCVAVATGWVERERLVAAHPDELLEDLSDLPRTLAALRLLPS